MISILTGALLYFLLFLVCGGFFLAAGVAFGLRRKLHASRAFSVIFSLEIFYIATVYFTFPELEEVRSLPPFDRDEIVREVKSDYHEKLIEAAYCGIYENVRTELEVVKNSENYEKYSLLNPEDELARAFWYCDEDQTPEE